MDLHSGIPWWLEENARGPDFPPLEESVCCDVAIVGAGITGALLALALAESGRDVVVLDRRDVARGSTAASTALLMAETDAGFVELSDRFGPEAATRIWKLGERAIARLAALSRRIAGGCAYARGEAWYLASDRGGARLLSREARRRHAVGLDVELLGRRELASRSSFPHRAALVTHGAVVDPFRLTVGALEIAARSGARVFDRTEAISFSESPDRVRLRTSRGATVESRELVVAAGYESARWLGLRLGRLRTSYALVTEPLPVPVPGWPGQALVWETARPYLYARISGDRILAGGEDTAFAGDHRAERRLARRVRRIARRLGSWLPEARIEIGRSWAGTFGESGDALPWIGRLPGARRIQAALGFGGNGITFAAIAAELLSASCRDDTMAVAGDLALFAFDR